MKITFNKYSEEFYWEREQSKESVINILKILHPDEKFDDALVESILSCIKISYLIYRCLRGITINSAETETFTRVEADSLAILESLVNSLESPEISYVDNLLEELGRYYSILNQREFLPFTRAGGGSFSLHFRNASRSLHPQKLKRLLNFSLRAVDCDAVSFTTDRLVAAERLITKFKKSNCKRLIFLGPLSSGFSELLIMQLALRNFRREFLIQNDLPEDIDIQLKPVVFMPYDDSFKGHMGVPDLMAGDMCVIVDDNISTRRIKQLRKVVAEGIVIYEQMFLIEA